MARSGIWTEADLQRVQARHGVVRPPPRNPHGPGGILAWDAAGTTGHAYGTADDLAPITGAFVLPAAPKGQRFAAFQNEVADLLERHRPGLVVVEAPMRLHAQAQRGEKARNEAAARQQFGLHACLLAECYRAGVRAVEADVGPVRQAVLGRSRWDHRSEIKPWIVAWCRAMGWDVAAGHDAADAAVMWMYAVTEVRAGRLALPA